MGGVVMVLFSFSNPRHISLIMLGIKHQTTRVPRKPRKNGAKPYSVGEKVQLYYRSRSKATCNNCIEDTYERRCGFYRDFGVYPEIEMCCEHSNFFGESVITSIIHYTNQMLKGMQRTSMDGKEIWLPTFDKLDAGERESWAIADGFTDFSEASSFFELYYGNEWIKLDWDCICWGKLIR